MSKVTLSIINRSYTFDVPEDDVATLKSAADLINTRAEESVGTSRMMTPERLAITAALQIAYDSLKGNIGGIAVDPSTLTRIATLRMRIDEILDPALEATKAE